MSDPLPLGKKSLFKAKKGKKQAPRSLKNSSILFAALLLIIFGSMVRLFDQSSIQYAQASTRQESPSLKLDSPLLVQPENPFFAQKELEQAPKTFVAVLGNEKIENQEFAQKIYDLVGESPIKEMVPFISKRDQKVAAFLIGIAKKESSFGLASPSKDGKTCYNYWGYKGEGQRGVGMGYACFASAEEAVTTVGNRIQVLVEKERNTPSRMVDTWKCGKSCVGDPGAPGWVSTVALYFEKIVS
jgi:hypothetical protein